MTTERQMTIDNSSLLDVIRFAMATSRGKNMDVEFRDKICLHIGDHFVAVLREHPESVEVVSKLFERIVGAQK
ncbi:MAG: hypothetical protein HC883_00455 [Bdellovibrionaceae bacterium]|nr:hypothetical protein [Pseudobdellovibrionaceae bacterium]